MKLDVTARCVNVAQSAAFPQDGIPFNYKAELAIDGPSTLDPDGVWGMAYITTHFPRFEVGKLYRVVIE